MKRATNKEKNIVLNALCSSHRSHGAKAAFTSRQLAEITGLERCKVVQVLFFWQDKGIVEQDKQINGWSLTEKATP